RDRSSERWIRFDARTARIIQQSGPPSERPLDFIAMMRALHRDLFAGLPGELVIGATGLLFAAAILSRIALFSPFVRRRAFGNSAMAGVARLRWLDVHNLTGVVTMAWTLVVGATGVINQLSAALFAGTGRNIGRSRESGAG